MSDINTLKPHSGGSAGQRGAVFGLSVAGADRLRRRAADGAQHVGGAPALAERGTVHRAARPVPVLPGGNVINLSVAVGMEFRGLRGALCALLGLISAPTAIVVGLGVVYARFQNDPHVQHVFAGLAAAAAGLLLSTGIKMLLLRGANGRRWRSSRWR